VLFIAGAGVSMPAGLPSFQQLVKFVYEKLDLSVFRVIEEGTEIDDPANADLNHQQIAEIKRFLRRDYDVVLGMLERRVDDKPSSASRVRAAIADILCDPPRSPAPIHKALMRLADRGGGSTIITTNFDMLLQQSTARKARAETYALGGIPRPSRRPDFIGVLHLHGVLAGDRQRASELVVTDQDFGEFYMRRRGIPDFIYDAARLFHLVLVGYSADDPPMRYLLNAVAADVNRFEDLKERFTFVGQDLLDQVELEDWKGRGIEPIPYDRTNSHEQLLRLLERWADLSAINGDPKRVEAEVRRIVKVARPSASEPDRDLFDHLFRRSSAVERSRLAAVASKARAHISWLDAIASILLEPAAGYRA
jgi:NAD-dependent SIR2 family protein deacetylase